jgi:heterodisulfide reductase subunit A
VRIGVYICHCGINIADHVDVEAVRVFAERSPHVAISRTYTYMCSDPGQELIMKDIEDEHLDRVVVAACSPLMHEQTFRKVLVRSGLNPYFLEIANIREHCSWVHTDVAGATEKAKDLVAAGIAKAMLLEPLESQEKSITAASLVIGGGISGIQAALDIAASGFHVFLVETETFLGGHVALLNRTFPYLEDARQLIRPKIEALLNDPHIDVMVRSEIESVEGSVGDFRVGIRTKPEPSLDPNEQDRVKEIKVGTIVVATGHDIFDPSEKTELGYGRYQEVITAAEFERLTSPEGPTQGVLRLGDRVPEAVGFIHCVGSRDKKVGHEYCSRVCCTYTAKQALWVRDHSPDTEVTVFYIDVRTFGKGYEELYEKAQERGVIYRKGVPSEIFRRGDRVVVRGEDALLGQAYEKALDLVVLATGLVPSRAAQNLRNLLKLSLSPDGFFMEAHPKLRPLDTAGDGIFLAGTCQGPKDIADSLAQAHGAASRATTTLFQGKVEIDPVVAFIDPEICSGCGLCEQVCEYAGLRLDPYRRVMTVNTAVCKGCGACNSACPVGAVSVRHYKPDQIMAQVDALCLGG